MNKKEIKKEQEAKVFKGDILFRGEKLEQIANEILGEEDIEPIPSPNKEYKEFIKMRNKQKSEILGGSDG